jgi:tetratricopeptide (TPR) repeat protein
MSDPRIENSRAALAKGSYDQVIQILKPLLSEMPDNLDVRSILTEAQEGMMLRLQLSQKTKKAEELIQSKDYDAAKKIINDVLKIDPTNPEASGLIKILEVPFAQDVTATVAFDMSEPVLEDAFPAQQGAEPFQQAAGHSDLDGLEAFTLPLSDLPEEVRQPATESTRNSEPAFGASEDFSPLSDFGAALSPQENTVEAHPAEETRLSSDGAVPFSLGGEGGKVESYLAEGRELIAEGKYQEGIDVLTRVFILDEENQEAQKLIDQAKELELNREREVNIILNEAISAYDSQNIDKAKALFEKVMQTFPGHREAEYYLKEIAGKSQAGGQSQSDASDDSGFELESAADNSFTFDADSSSSGDGLEGLIGKQAASPPSPLTDPMFADAVPSTTGKVKMPAAGAKQKEGKKAPVGLIIIIVSALLVVSALFIVVPMLWNKIFSPSPRAVSVPSSESSKAKPGDAGAAKTQTATPSAPQRNLSDIIAEAKAAVEDKQFEKAVNLYTEAEKQNKTDLDIKMALQSAKDSLAKQQEELAKNQKFVTDYEKAVQYFKMQEYGEALRISWRLIYPDDTLARQMGKADTIRKIIKNGYYNWGVKELKAGNPLAARKNFQDLVDSAAGDSKGRELLDFSRKYNQSSLDDKYRSYVQELSYRSIDD